MLKPVSTVHGDFVLSFVRDVSEQRAALEAMRANDQQMRKIVDNIRDYAIYLLDAEGHVVTWNPGGERIKGYTADEIVGKHFSCFFPPEQVKLGRPAELLRLAAERGRIEEEGWRQRKDGSLFWTDSILTAIRDSDGAVTGFAKVTRDRSEQHDALEALRASEQQMRSVVENIRDYAIYLLDAEGNVATWNAGGERIKGYTADEIIGRHFSCFFPRHQVELGRPAELLRLAAERGRIEEEGWRQRKDGSLFWTDSILTAIRDSDGAVTGFAKVTRDFTERKRAEEAFMLQLSSALLANLDAGTLLDAISASIREIVPADMACLGLYDPVQNNIAIQLLGEYDHSLVPREIRMPVEGTVVGAALTTREAVTLGDLTVDARTTAQAPYPVALGMRSTCAVPLIHRGEAIGILAIARREPHSITPNETQMLTKIADQVAMAVDNAIAFRRIGELRDRLSQEKQYLEEEIALERRFDDVVGESVGLRRVLKEIETVAPTDATVLIQGETGTGKELLARAIHRLSPRHERTFIKINCAAIPAGLIESELFGHEKGAFTGAIGRKIGRLELAHEGTLFLDEVGELPLDLQPKLLRALQEREIERIGGTRAIPVNVRLIAATNRDLAQMVAEKQFRSDLYYRLKVFPVFSPPLRERTGDIPILVRHFVETHSRRMGKHIETIPEATMAALVRWQWPGNIRELENFLERAVILTRGPVLYVPLAELEIQAARQAEEPENPNLQAAEREHILRVLREADGQVGGPNGAAARLGLKRTTLNSKMKKLGIERGL
jgi:PAS domain S-box-containing protein